ncbi:hexose transporter [Suhomyces tanzawaensis NRRL Y-17324]|uniref:Hexose transporter n=1 Tax=Suhomyces tanzawaensis NRRL Y-17324 TaxID=984487 RepID=A0A1E4SBH3_9ASCO|nr:hexose transporter [Suhomyces tanzawaensis NRRL Y-17324]ODV76853.1 hexose transporter [Suhomyces tanzawaensis NRRL Y-17324]
MADNKETSEIRQDSIALDDRLIHEGIDELVKLDKSWWKYSYLRNLHWFVFLITLTSTNNGYDGSMLNGLQSLSTWQKAMGHPKGQKLGALSNGALYGNLVSFLFASYVSDKFGRKWCIMGGNFLTLVGAVLQGASTNYAFFLVSRIILGFGSGIATVSSPPLISEIAYPTYRPVCTTFYNVCWYLGALVAAWVTYGTRTLGDEYAWKIPSYLQGFMPVFQIAFMYWVPESPRWLISKGKNDKAQEVLARIHTGNATDEKSRKLVAFEMQEIQSTLEMEKIMATSRYVDFITIKSYRKRIFLAIFTGIMMQLSGNGLVSYYLNLVLNSIGIRGEKEQLQINGGLMAYNLVVSCIIAASVARFRRRTLFLTCVSGMLITYILWTILSALNQQRNFEDKSFANGVLAMIFLYYLSYNIGINGLPFLYVTEILPYSHRAKGINIFQLTQQLVSVYNGYVNPIAMDAIQWKYYIVYCCILVVELLVVYFFYVETSGYTLEEVAKVFGDDPNEVLMPLHSPSGKFHSNHHENENSDISSEKIAMVGSKV